MEIIRNILDNLKHVQEENENEYVSETEIYNFVIENCGYNQVAESLEFFFIELAASQIAAELYKQDEYGIPSFEEDYISQLLNDREESEYHGLFEYYYGKQAFLEYHTINNKTYFFGEDLKIEYSVLIKMFSMLLTTELNRVLEKLKNTLNKNVPLTSWCDLILGGHEGEYLNIEKERIDSIIKGVLF